MAKKKSEPKASKKNEQKKKAQSIEDRTFGLKNKNRSKKVMHMVDTVKKSVNNSGDKRAMALEEQRKRQKVQAKARRTAEKEEQDALFGAALMAINTKKTTDQQEGKAAAKGRDADDENPKKGTSRAMKMMFQMDAQEMEEKLREDPNYVPTIEDRIESERQTKVEELKKSGTGTKITAETFEVWHQKKRKRRAEAAKKMVETELRKKKGGKGLAVLSGRDLYEYKRDLFIVSDENAQVITEKKDKDITENDIENVTAQVQGEVENLFLEGTDDDLDDLDEE